MQIQNTIEKEKTINMRMKSDEDTSSFNTCEEFGVTEVVADCIGPLIDISKIKAFRDIEYVRYLTEEEICDKMPSKDKNNEIKWTPEDIRNITKKALQHSKLAVRYIDSEMVMQLCRAKSFCSIKIISTVPDIELFNLVKRVLIDFSNQMVKYNPSTSKSKGYKVLEDEDFEHIISTDSQLPGILLYYKEKLESGKQNIDSYKIAIDDDALVFSTIAEKNDNIPSFQEWIGGIREDNPVQRLKEVLIKRKHIYDGAAKVTKMCEGDRINLNNYTLIGNYYVYDSDLKEQLKKRINSIKHIIDTGNGKNKPICVFLAGTPGTGKTYFVNCFAEDMQCSKQYPMTSLSGVSSANFYDAIEYHVEQVYNAKYDSKQKASIAFLDEIDTASGYYAFRFLMDAMTGSRTNDKGVAMKNFKSGTVENLVWFFAGSAGATRQEFMNQLKSNERKVIDFFDRIHFDMKLPGVEEPGQAILTLMSAIKEYWKKDKLSAERDKLPTEISIKVLLAFACTKWTSTRSIMTICRVAAAHKKADDKKITLELFEGIDTSEEFHKQCNYIEEHVHDKRMITIEWEKGAIND